MVDIALHGNGRNGPACALRRAACLDLFGAGGIDCNLCDGKGRIARPIEDIIGDHVRWARDHYWPGRFE